MDPENIIVNTVLGPVRGNQRISYLGDRFLSFRGIPYAQPPIGKLRFRDPLPIVDPWTIPVDATKPSVHAPFVDETEKAEFVISEDCLVLNIHTREVHPKRQFPVMVWIHGGSFRVGSSCEHMHGPDFLMQKNVVLVTFNYRIGALGFLTIDDPKYQIPGNAGMKDQTMALRWVKDNISAFGGDPNNVTVFGNSSGAISVDLHMLSDHSNGLFHRAIIQSGFAHPECSTSPKNDWTQRLAKVLGWSGEGGDDSLYNFLCAADADDIVKHQYAILTNEEYLYSVLPFGPAMEAYVGDQCFLIKHPLELMKNPWSKNVPLIIGGNSDEMIMLNRAFKKYSSVLQSVGGFELLIPPKFGLQNGSEESRSMAKRIMRNYYFGGEPKEDNFRPTMQAWSHRYMWYPLVLCITARLENPARSAPTYLYRFDIESKIFNWKKLQFAGEHLSGASHADELHYMFKCSYLKDQLPDTSLEIRTMQKIVALWTTFAEKGDPNCQEIAPIVWPAIVDLNDPLHCFNITEQPSSILLPETPYMLFWRQLYKEYSVCGCERLFHHECANYQK